MGTLASRIKEAMGTMPKGKFAAEVGVSPGAVTQWLDGATKALKAETAIAIERVTGYRASWLVSGKGAKQVTIPLPPPPAGPLAERLNAERDTDPYAQIERALASLVIVGSAKDAIMSRVRDEAEQAAATQRAFQDLLRHQQGKQKP